MPRSGRLSSSLRPPGRELLGQSMVSFVVRTQPEVTRSLGDDPRPKRGDCGAIVKQVHQRADHAVVLIFCRGASHAEGVPLEKNGANLSLRNSGPVFVPWISRVPWVALEAHITSIAVGATIRSCRDWDTEWTSSSGHHRG